MSLFYKFIPFISLSRVCINILFMDSAFFFQHLQYLKTFFSCVWAFRVYSCLSRYGMPYFFWSNVFVFWNFVFFLILGLSEYVFFSCLGISLYMCLSECRMAILSSLFWDSLYFPNFYRYSKICYSAFWAFHV